MTRPPRRPPTGLAATGPPDPGGDRASLLAELETRRLRITQLETQQAQLTQQTTSQQTELNNRAQQIQQLQTERTSLQTERTNLQTERTNLQAQVAQLRADLDRIRTEHPRLPVDTIASSVSSLLEQHQAKAAQPTATGMTVALRSIDLEVKGFVDVENNATHLTMPKVGEAVESNALSSLKLSFASVPAPVPPRPPT